MPQTSHDRVVPAVQAQVPQSVFPLLQVADAQLLVVAAGHDPLPLQLAAAVLVPPEQDWARQLVTGNVQLARVVPSHFPAQVPEPAHAVRAVVTATHVPELLHASHWPVQAVLQQTLSQNPL